MHSLYCVLLSDLFTVGPVTTRTAHSGWTNRATCHMADLYGNGSHTEGDENLPATTSMQLLIELDSLLRYRSGALESVVLSMLLDKGQKNRRSGKHG